MTHNFADLGNIYSDKIARSRTRVEGVKAVRLSANTSLRPVKVDAAGTITAFAVRYHDTDVVVLHADGSIDLDTGGWVSKTTVERMHEYTPRNISFNGKDILSHRWDADPRILAWVRADGADVLLDTFRDTLHIPASAR